MKTKYTPLTRIVKGEEVNISSREMKKTIMDVNNWNEAEYRKQYDIFKNKLRFYEEVQRSRGIKDVETQSPQQLLYKISRAKKRYGDEYEPSQEVQQILAVSAHSISKGKKIAQSATGKSYMSAVSKIVSIRFKGFTDFYDKAAEILEKIQDPVKQEEALTEFANYLHRLYPRRGKDKGAGKQDGAFADGEVYGSDANMTADMGGEFDITQWLPNN